MAVGRIGKPHGLHGWVTVKPMTDEPERRFAPGTTLLLEEKAVEVRDSRIMAKPLTVWLAGCDSRDDAQGLRGQLLYVDLADDDSPDADDEYYDHQLVGLSVWQAGAAIGVVKEVLHLPAQDVLVVARSSGEEALVPFVEQVVPVVDLAAGRLEVGPVEGLFDGEN